MAVNPTEDFPENGKEGPDPAAYEGWSDSLRRFDVFYWPMFQRHGYSKDFAYLYWTLNRVVDAIDFLPEHPKPPDDGEEWKHL